MPSKKNKRTRTSKANGDALSRPMQGIDSKSFIFNDYVPLTLSNPTNDNVFTFIITADVNGYTWTAQDQAGVTVSAGTSLYANITNQFAVQGMFYSQYYTKSVEMDLVLSSGGGVYSMSPLISLVNPQSANPFVFGTGGNAFL